MPEHDYRSAADELNAQKQAQQMQALAQLLGIGMKGGQEQQNIQAQGEQARQTKQQDYDQAMQTAMHATGANTPQEAVQKLYGSGGSLRVGEMAIGADPYAHSQMMMANQDQKNLNGAVSIYNHAMPKMADQMATAQKLMETLNDPNNPATVGTVKSLMIRLHGMNRYNQEEASDMLQHTLQQQGANLGNFFGSADNAKIDPTQVEGIRQVVQHAVGAMKNEHDLIRNQAFNSYQMSNTANSGTMAKLQNLGQPMDERLDDFNRQYIVPWQAEKQRQAQQVAATGPQTQGGIWNTAKSGMNRVGNILFGSNSGATSQDPSMTAGAQQSNPLQGFVPAITQRPTAQAGQPGQQSLLDEYNALKAQRDAAGMK